MTNDEKYIKQVIQLARSAAEKNIDPFASLLVKDDQIVASATNQCMAYSDPTAHAELTVISEYCRSHNLISLEGYTLYSSAEPCVMCSGAIHWSRISRVVFCMSQEHLQQFSGGKPKPSCNEIINIGGKKIEIRGPVLPELGIQLFKDFPFKSKKARYEENKLKNEN